MDKTSKPLPGLKIGDESIEASGWGWADGWHGLIPSQSTLNDTTKILGAVIAESNLSNGITYDFLDGSVRVTIRDDAPVVFKIWIDANTVAPYSIPANIELAMLQFGKLKVVQLDRQDGAIYERPGMRICCHSQSTPARILWMEIYKPNLV